MIPQSFGSRALWRAPSTGACGVGDYPTPDLSRRESASRYTSEKSKQFGPDGAPFPYGAVVSTSFDVHMPQRGAGVFHLALASLPVSTIVSLKLRVGDQSPLR